MALDVSGEPVATRTVDVELQQRTPRAWETQSSVLWRHLVRYGLLGCTGAVLVGSVEFIDVSLRVSPYLNSWIQRLSLLMYFGLGPAVGLLMGLYVGLYVFVAALIYEFLFKRLSRLAGPVAASWLAFAAPVCMLAVILNRIPSI